jgi:prepilin-type processing-associated H-X9-DG protein
MNTRPSPPVKLTVLTHSRPILTQLTAFTVAELGVVVGFVFILAFLWMSTGVHTGQRPRFTCINNLKQIGTAYRIWANDNGDVYPSEAPISKGGWSDYLALPNAGSFCWTNYVIMQNELGESPKVINCSEDERVATTNFGFTSNEYVSYFVGVSVTNHDPSEILGGDRNLSQGPNPPTDYGYSPANGSGNDVQLRGPVTWSKKMHSAGNYTGLGNILFADGSVQQTTSAGFRQNYLNPLLKAESTNHIPVRVIFP